MYFGAGVSGTLVVVQNQRSRSNAFQDSQASASDRIACSKEKLGMPLHLQPEQPMAFAGVEQPMPFDDLPQVCSLQREWRRCGKPSCRCLRGMLHGPYWYLRWREGGRQRRRYVRLERVEAMRVAVEERRRLRPSVWSLRQTLVELRHLEKEMHDARHD